ncbi:MAG: amino acid permease [Methanomassiliicoccus sp.]|jgi:APA family basic amino acid/polyamine antiporter|nr:amino acid permease [Methanomassiliicoccus sp.]
MEKLQRSLGFWGATTIGIGAIIGTGIFVLVGVASGIAGPAVIISFIIAGAVALLSGLSTAELSSFIHEAGGSYIYTTKAFGKFPGFIVGWMKSFDYIVGASAVSVGFAAYFTYFVGIPTSTANLVVIGTIWPIVLMTLNLKGIKEASWVNSLLVVLKIIALLIFITTCAVAILSSGDYSNYQPFVPEGFSGIMSGAAIIFFAFIGFNTIAVMAEEIKEPERNVPRAILFSFAICTAIYIGVAIVAVGVVNWQLLGTSSAPLEYALRTVTDNVFILQYVAISALFATTSVIMSSIMGASRALFAMARQDVIPSRLAKISKQNVPALTVLLCGIIISGIVLLSNGDLELLASIFNFGTLLTFFFINLSLIKLRKTMPDVPRKFKVPLYPYTPVFAMISCIGIAFYLKPSAVVTAIFFLMIGIGVYILNKKVKA